MQKSATTRTIDKVLSLLEGNKGVYVSGAEMAESIGVSRNAIWKAINELKAQGYQSAGEVYLMTVDSKGNCSIEAREDTA